MFNAPFSNTRSVAELVLAEIIILMRGIPERNAAAHRGGWLKTATGSHEVRGKTLGIVGYGHIGTQVGVLAESLGMQVVYLRCGVQAFARQCQGDADARCAARGIRCRHAARPGDFADFPDDRRRAIGAHETWSPADQRLTRHRRGD